MESPQRIRNSSLALPTRVGRLAGQFVISGLCQRTGNNARLRIELQATRQLRCGETHRPFARRSKGVKKRRARTNAYNRRAVKFRRRILPQQSRRDGYPQETPEKPHHTISP